MAFVRVPGNPDPEGAEEVWLEGRGGVKLRALVAPAQGPVRGSVLLFPGRTEFIEKYFEVICELQQRGFAVFAMDWRGQGLSSRELPNRMKGHFQTFEDPVQDVYAALRLYGDRLPRPHIVLAHSMGGAISLRALQSNRISADAAFFSAPMWGIAGVSNLAEDFARFMTAMGFGGNFSPGVQTRWTKQSFKKNALTHDEARYERSESLIVADPRLGLAGPTLGWVTAALDVLKGFRQPSALAHLKMPVTVLSAEQDTLVDNTSHTDIAALLPNARHTLIPGAHHEIMMETDDIRAKFWTEFDRMADMVAPRGAAQMAAVRSAETPS